MITQYYSLPDVDCERFPFDVKTRGLKQGPGCYYIISVQWTYLMLVVLETWTSTYIAGHVAMVVHANQGFTSRYGYPFLEESSPQRKVALNKTFVVICDDLIKGYGRGLEK